MDTRTDNLESLETLAARTVDELRTQHDISEQLMETSVRPSALMLLSHSLRVVQWVQSQRNALRRLGQAG